MRRSVIWQLLGAAAVGILFANASLVLFNTSNTNDLVLRYLLLANVFLTVVLLVVTLLYSNSRRGKHSEKSRNRSKIVTALRQLDTIFQARTKLNLRALQAGREDLSVSEFAEESSSFLSFLADESRFIFDNITGEPCAVSLNFLVPSNSGKPGFNPQFRDRRSLAAREHLYKPSGIYPYDSHSPFVEIIEGKTHHDFYLCNNLRAESRRGRYENGNSQWRKYYNSTLVVPIREPSTVAGDNIIGFFCVDSLAGYFDEELCVPICRILSNTVFHVAEELFTLEKWQSNQENNKRSAS